MATMREIEVTVNHDAATAALLAIRDLAEGTGGGLTSADRLAKISALAQEALATKRAHPLPCIAFTPEAVEAFKDGLESARKATPNSLRSCCVCGEPAYAVVQDQREIEPVRGGFGNYQRFDYAGPPLRFCKQHFRPELKFMRDGSIELESREVVANVKPREIELDIGGLKVAAERGKNGQARGGRAVVSVDGKQLPRVRSVSVQASVDSCWVCRLEFMP